MTSLEENALYLFMLQAVTGAGEGEGRTVSTQTEEDGKFTIMGTCFGGSVAALSINLGLAGGKLCQTN